MIVVVQRHGLNGEIGGEAPSRCLVCHPYMVAQDQRFERGSRSTVSALKQTIHNYNERLEDTLYVLHCESMNI